MILSLLLAGMGTAATAQNINLPIIQTKYTADPAPYVHNDTVYLYTTHDEDGVIEAWASSSNVSYII